MSPMTETRRRRARRLFAVAALACAALPTAPALAAPDQLSLIEDEKLMLESGPEVQAQALDEAKALGADLIRANVIWARVAPSSNSTKKPKGFNGKKPESYGGNLAMLDSFVAGAQARGMQVLLTPTGPIPAWASRCKGSVAARKVCKPDPKLFGDFVRALGTKYPTVKYWSIWNEPNLGSWLKPQYEVVGGVAVQKSASLYRSLAKSAISSLRATGHKTTTDQIWLGETAPLGDDPSGCSAQRKLRAPKGCAKKITKTSPETFLRGVFCLSKSGGSLGGVEGK